MKKLILGLMFLFSSSSLAGTNVQPVTLLDNVTATGAGAYFKPFGVKRSFQAEGETSSGAGSATVDVEVSNDCVNYVTAGTITLTLSTTTSDDGFVTDAAWVCVRGNVTAISGTGASVSLVMGQQL